MYVFRAHWLGRAYCNGLTRPAIAHCIYSVRFAIGRDWTHMPRSPLTRSCETARSYWSFAPPMATGPFPAWLRTDRLVCAVLNKFSGRRLLHAHARGSQVARLMRAFRGLRSGRPLPVCAFRRRVDSER